MPKARIESAIPASEPPQTYDLECATTGIGADEHNYANIYITKHKIFREEKRNILQKVSKSSQYI